MIVSWVLLGIMAGFVLIVISPIRSLLHIHGDLSNYAIYLGVLGVLLMISAIITIMGREQSNN